MHTPEAPPIPGMFKVRQRYSSTRSECASGTYVVSKDWKNFPIDEILVAKFFPALVVTFF